MFKKDWNGNSKSTFVQLGANNHSEHDYEEHSFYSTDPETVRIFLKALKRDGIKLCHNLYEPAVGLGHIYDVLEEEGYNVIATDLISRGRFQGGTDFLALEANGNCCRDIITNPPYRLCNEFVEHAIKMVKDGQKIVMLLKIQFLEGKARRKLFDKYPPKYVYVNSERQTCYINGDMTKKMSSAACYCWFVWEKGFTGDPVIKWI